MNRSMIIVQIFSLFCFCYSCRSQGKGSDKQERVNVKSDSSLVSIDSVYLSLTGRQLVSHQEVPGQFNYILSDAANGKYVTRFISDNIFPVIYKSYSDTRKDTIVLGGKVFRLERKFDPASIKIYRILFNNKKYLGFIGKSQSASGSGTQVTYFILTELNDKDRVSKFYEFESRFGTINSIVDYNGDGALDYFIIVNADKLGEYRLTVNNIENKSATISNVSILLKYHLNDRFSIIENSLTK